MVGDGFIFVERDFPTSEKKLFKSLHCFWHSESSKAYFFVGICFLLLLFHWQASMFFLYHDGIFGKLVYNNFVWNAITEDDTKFWRNIHISGFSHNFVHHCCNARSVLNVKKRCIFIVFSCLRLFALFQVTWSMSDLSCAFFWKRKKSFCNKTFGLRWCAFNLRKIDKCFRHPFTWVVAGPTSCEKTEFMAKFIQHVKQMMTPVSQRIVWCYREWQHRWKSRHIFAGVKDFCPNFPKLSRIIFGPLFVWIFSHEDHISDDIQKKSSSDFGRHFFQIKTCWARFLLVFSGSLPRFSGFLRRFHKFCPDFHGFCQDFQGFCLDFHKIKTFGHALAPPPPPPLSDSIALILFQTWSLSKDFLSEKTLTEHKGSYWFWTIKWTKLTGVWQICSPRQSPQRPQCHIRIVQLSISRVNSVSDLCCCWLLSC